jgi:hypothetical protein
MSRILSGLEDSAKFILLPPASVRFIKRNYNWSWPKVHAEFTTKDEDKGVRWALPLRTCLDNDGRYPPCTWSLLSDTSV